MDVGELSIQRWTLMVTASNTLCQLKIILMLAFDFWALCFDLSAWFISPWLLHCIKNACFPKLHGFCRFCLFQCWTPTVPASNKGRWSVQRPTLYILLHSVLNADLVLAVAFCILLPLVHALTPMHAVGPLFPVLYLASLTFLWFSASDLFSIACCYSHCMVFFGVLISCLYRI